MDVGFATRTIPCSKSSTSTVTSQQANKPTSSDIQSSFPFHYTHTLYKCYLKSSLLFKSNLFWNYQIITSVLGWTYNCSYRFIIYDSFGDGLCCQYGEGSYEISLNGAFHLVSCDMFECWLFIYSRIYLATHVVEEHPSNQLHWYVLMFLCLYVFLFFVLFFHLSYLLCTGSSNELFIIVLTSYTLSSLFLHFNHVSWSILHWFMAGSTIKKSAFEEKKRDRIRFGNC